MNGNSGTPSMITFGETMIRYSTKNFERLEQANEFEVKIGGAESNVAVAFTKLGGDAEWVSKLTWNGLGKFIRNKVREHGVRTPNIIWTDDYRNGKYYIEFGKKPRSTAVIYDRAESAISNIELDEIDWEIVQDYDLFHTTGITPALSQSCEKAVAKLMDKAHDYGTKVVFDLNYRAKLWSFTEARKALTPLLEEVDILFVSREDAVNVLKKSGDSKEILKELQNIFDLDIGVMTLGSEGAIAIQNDKISFTEPYEVEEVDRVGAGDALDAGFAYTYLQTKDIKKALDWGMAMAAFDHTIPGDVILTDISEIQDTLGNQSFDIKR